MSYHKKRYCIFGCDALDARRVPLHQFPNPKTQPGLYATWVSIVGNALKERDPKSINGNKKICDCHFDSESKLPSRRLIRSAVPRINLHRVHQSASSIVDIDHSYCLPLWLIGYQTDIRNIPGPSTGDSSCSSKSTLLSAGKTDHTYSRVDGFLRDHSYCKIAYQRAVHIPDTGDQGDQYTTSQEREAPGRDTVAADTAVAADDPDDVNDCDDVPNPAVPEADRQEIFSWEKADIIIADETDELTGVVVQEPPGIPSLDLDDVSMYNDEGPPSKGNDSDGECAEYICNECGATIKGFRYMCVQCADWDLCGACEARTAHAAHYVLRVPSPRPYKEIQAILAAIRHQMLSENLFLPETVPRVKEEVKDELEEEGEIPGVSPEVLEPDPLGLWDGSFHDDDIDDILEMIPERLDEDVYPSPRRKRRRISPDPLDNTELFTPHNTSSLDNTEHFTPHNTDPLDNTELFTPHNTSSLDNTEHFTSHNTSSLDNTELFTPHNTDPLDNTELFTPHNTSSLDNTEHFTPHNTTYDDLITILSDDETYETPPDLITLRNDLDRTSREPACSVSSPIKTINIDTLTKTHRRKKSRIDNIPMPFAHQRYLDDVDIPVARRVIVGGKRTSDSGNPKDTKRLKIVHTDTIDTGSCIPHEMSQNQLDTERILNALKTDKNGDKNQLKPLSVRLPPGASWTQLVKMLNSKVTVRLEDVTKKKGARKKTEINEI